MVAGKLWESFDKAAGLSTAMELIGSPATARAADGGNRSGCTAGKGRRAVGVLVRLLRRITCVDADDEAKPLKGSRRQAGGGVLGCGGP